MEDVQETRLARLLEANALYEQGAYARAAETARALLAVLPGDAEMRYILAAALTASGAYDAARAEIARIRQTHPMHAGAARQEICIDRAEGKIKTQITHLYALIDMLRTRIAAGGEVDAARVFLASAYSHLGAALTLAGEPAPAAAAFLASSALETARAQKAVEYSNALFAANYLPPHLRAAHAGLARGYGALFADVQTLASAADAARGHERIRIGYISPDLRDHPVAAFIRPLLRDFSRERFAVYCYAAGTEDAVSAQLRHGAVHWRSIRGMTAEEAAACVRSDEIDILVDLSGHTEDNCLPVLAHRPAPVQVTGIGYFNTTGLAAVDYLLGDMHTDPPGAEDAAVTEQVIRLPHSHFCYALPDGLPAVTAPPMERNGYVTFGSFNNFSKVTDEALALWRQVLAAVPGSRLLLKSKLFTHAEGHEIGQERLLRAGIPLERAEMRGFSCDHLIEYADMDIALDTFPYTGGITTCEALSMGVPVVTLCGESHGARFGESLLRNADLPELIAETPDDYVRIAAALASDPSTLHALRIHLRSILSHAPLTNVQMYVHDMKNAYTNIWERFVRQM